MWILQVEKRIALLLLLMIIGFRNIHGQQFKVDNFGYSNGIYATKEDFVNKKVTKQLDLKIDKIELIIETDSLIRRCFFRDKKSGKKIKKVFAVVYNGNIYFQISAILKNQRVKKEALSSSSNHSFVLVFIGGNNLLYSEAGLINHWKVGLATGVSSGLGGVTGYVVGEKIQQSYPATTVFGMGLVWDLQKHSFTIFSTCEIFNDFISDYQLDKINCNVEFINLFEIREKIEKIR